MPNALIYETSPYLLQHAHNPVDWLPWGEAAFSRARDEDKLVFLSVGYSTCHWCHVMERESFEKDRVARVMNHHFINIKVDREERPDIDATYMAFVQAVSGQGGWPMSVWLTSAGKPVFGGTYYPPEDGHGRPGFERVCHELGRLWRDDRAKMEAGAERMMDHLWQEAGASPLPEGMAGSKVFGDFIDVCESMHDEKLGGFGGAPKFPRPVVVRALMQLSERFGRETDEGKSAWAMSERTLRAMAAGGMHDHLAGGFHRYSVDRYWHVPHYEKMLYDQAQLAMAYLDAWQISGDDGFRDVVEGIFSYLIEELRDDGGAYHAAEDADSLQTPDADHKLEGAFWTWRADEISSLLAPRDASVFCAAFGVEAAGNARPESDPHGELEGRNTLFRAVQDEDLAVMFGLAVEDVRTILADSSEILTKVRSGRPLPHRDDKIVTAWNGLAIGALARGARVLARADLAAAAVASADFLKRELWHDGCLYRAWRKHRGNAAGFPADYVFLISGLIDLHAVVPDGGWLDWAVELQQQLDARFWDEEMTGYVMRPGLNGEILLVIREDYDGAEPAPNHVAVENLLRLAVLVDLPDYAVRAESLLRCGARVLETRPFSAPVLLAALDLNERGVMKFQCGSELEPAVMKKLRTSYFPRAIFTKGGGDGVTLCEGFTCRPWR